MWNQIQIDMRSRTWIQVVNFIWAVCCWIGVFSAALFQLFNSLNVFGPSNSLPFNIGFVGFLIVFVSSSYLDVAFHLSFPDRYLQPSVAWRWKSSECSKSKPARKITWRKLSPNLSSRRNRDFRRSALFLIVSLLGSCNLLWLVLFLFLATVVKFGALIGVTF